MEIITDYLVPGILLGTSLLALRRQEDAYGTMLRGAEQGLRLMVSITPALILLLTAVTMLQRSGAAELLSRLLAPALEGLGIPPQTALLVLIRPVSGSAALAVGAQLMAQYGPGSLVGTTAAVMLGSTETTFYTISVYFGAAGVSRTRYAVPAALLADLVGFTAAAWSVRLLLPELA